ncbi:MAG TPA: ATP-binding protein, partial [Gemmatimonadaceae bacterium]
LVGSPSLSWMGVPLRTPSRIIGVLVLQDYARENCYSEHDLRFLAEVGSQAAIVIERKQAEVALRDRDTELAVILESTADGILAVDRRGKVIKTNRRFAELWRIPSALIDSGDDDALQRHVVSQLSDPEEFLSKVRLLYGTADEGRDTLHFTDGRVFERHSAPILKDGAIDGRVWSFHDITARTHAEAAAAALETQLHHAQRLESVGLLAGGVAHEFNNMLAAILGNTELALRQLDPAQQVHADLLEVHKSAQRAAELTRQLLAFARRQPVALQVLDLNVTVPALLSMLQRLIGEDIEVVLQPAAQLWPVKMDPSQMEQIVTNLVVNARQAIANVGTLTIATANHVFDAAFCATHAGIFPGEYVRLTVTDTGSGMDAVTLDRVFEPFFTTKDVGKGTGLGLAMVYGAVKQHGGFITVSSELGHGTTFEVHLPRYVNDQPVSDHAK